MRAGASVQGVYNGPVQGGCVHCGTCSGRGPCMAGVVVRCGPVQGVCVAVVRRRVVVKRTQAVQVCVEQRCEEKVCKNSDQRVAVVRARTAGLQRAAVNPQAGGVCGAAW